MEKQITMKELSFDDFKKEVLADYALALGCKEVNQLLIDETGGELLEVALNKVINSGEERVTPFIQEKKYRSIVEGTLDVLFDERSRQVNKRGRTLLHPNISLSYVVGKSQSLELFGENPKKTIFLDLKVSHKKQYLSRALLESLVAQKQPIIITLYDTVGVVDDEFFMAKDMVFKANSWDYTKLCQSYAEAQRVGVEEKKVVFVVVNNAGTHPDGLLQMRRWLIDMNMETNASLNAIESEVKSSIAQQFDMVSEAQKGKVTEQYTQFWKLLDELPERHRQLSEIAEVSDVLTRKKDYSLNDIQVALEVIIRYFTPLGKKEEELHGHFIALRKEVLGVEIVKDAIVPHVAIEPQYDETSELQEGKNILSQNFSRLFQKYPKLCVFAKDRIIYQATSGQLQTKENFLSFEEQVAQAVGFATVGCKVIIEVASYDNFKKGVEVVCQLKTNYKKHNSEAIVFRTQEHSLFNDEDIHLADSLNCSVCIPRNMVQAIGFYSYLLTHTGVSLVIESKHIYSQWDKVPANIMDFTIPVGESELLFSGKDITILSYGKAIPCIEKAATQLEYFDISVELIDARCVLPFDLSGVVSQSVQRTGKLLIVSSDNYRTLNSSLIRLLVEEESVFSNLKIAPASLELIIDDETDDIGTLRVVSSIFDKVYNFMNNYDAEEYPKIE